MPSFVFPDPKPFHKIIIKSKSPDQSAKTIVSKTITATKNHLNITFNKVSQNSSFIIATQSPYSEGKA